MVTSTPIPPLPQAPSRSDGQAAFNLYADPFIAAMPPMVVNINTRLEWIATQVNAAEGYKNAAAISAGAAADSAIAASGFKDAAAQQVGLAADQVALANTAKGEAQAARDSAQNFAAAAGSAAGTPALAGKSGKALVVNANADGVLWGDPYPAYAGKARMSLQVLPNEQGVRWVDVGDRIGDVLVSARNPGALYLPADGAVYLKSAYTELFQLLGLLGGTKANSWSTITSGFGSDEIKGAATNSSGVWIFLSSTGVIRRSVDDGLTLTTIVGVTVTNGTGVVYCGNSTFIAFGNFNSYVFKSTDNGLTWAVIPPASFPAGTYVITSGCSDGLGNIILGGSSSGNAYVLTSTDYGVSWAPRLVVTAATCSAVGLGKDTKAFCVIASGSVSYSLYTSGLTGSWVSKSGINGAGAAGTASLCSIDTDGLGLWVFNMVSAAFRVGNNGDGTTLVLPVTGKVVTDKNGTWLIGNQVSTNDAIDFSAANLAAPVASSLAASRAGTFMVGATAGSLRRSVPVFPYDSATQFALPNISSPIGVKAYIKAKEPV